jgi:hypothetical protein
MADAHGTAQFLRATGKAKTVIWRCPALSAQKASLFTASVSFNKLSNSSESFERCRESDRVARFDPGIRQLICLRAQQMNV